MAAVLTACAASPSDGYDRHNLSRLVAVPGSSSEFVYEAGRPPASSIQAQQPGASQAETQAETQAESQAEAVRMRWLAEWLAVQGQCPHGYEVVDRRQFGPFEYNPLQAQFRYFVRCREAPVATSEGK